MARVKGDIGGVGVLSGYLRVGLNQSQEYSGSFTWGNSVATPLRWDGPY